MADDWMWETIKESTGALDLDSVRTAVVELNQGLEGEDEIGYWQDIVQAIYHNPPGDAGRDYIAKNLNRSVFDRLKDQFGPTDVEMPVEEAQGGRRRRRKTHRKKGRKSTRKHHR